MDTLLLYYIKLLGFLSISSTEHDFWTNNHFVFFIVCTVRHIQRPNVLNSRSFNFGVACFCQELDSSQTSAHLEFSNGKLKSYLQVPLGIPFYFSLTQKQH